MKRRLLFLVLILSFVAQSNAGPFCLGRAPGTVSDLEKKIRLNQRNLYAAKWEVQIFQELAQDAGRRSHLSKGVALAAVTPLSAALGGVAAEIAINIGIVTSTFAESAIILAPVIASGAMSAIKLNQAGNAEINYDAEVQIQNESASAETCSYEKMLLKLNENYEQVQSRSFNGGVLNDLRDRLTLGSFSSSQSNLLYTIALLKLKVLEAQHRDLNLIMIGARLRATND